MKCPYCGRAIKLSAGKATPRKAGLVLRLPGPPPPYGKRKGGKLS